MRAESLYQSLRPQPHHGEALVALRRIGQHPVREEEITHRLLSLH